MDGLLTLQSAGDVPCLLKEWHAAPAAGAPCLWFWCNNQTRGCSLEKALAAERIGATAVGSEIETANSQRGSPNTKRILSVR